MKVQSLQSDIFGVATPCENKKRKIPNYEYNNLENVKNNVKIHNNYDNNNLDLSHRKKKGNIIKETRSGPEIFNSSIIFA